MALRQIGQGSSAPSASFVTPMEVRVRGVLLLFAPRLSKGSFNAFQCAAAGRSIVDGRSRWREIDERRECTLYGTSVEISYQTLPCKQCTRILDSAKLFANIILMNSSVECSVLYIRGNI